MVCSGRSPAHGYGTSPQLSSAAAPNVADLPDLSYAAVAELGTDRVRVEGAPGLRDKGRGRIIVPRWFQLYRRLHPNGDWQGAGGTSTAVSEAGQPL